MTPRHTTLRLLLLPLVRFSHPRTQQQHYHFILYPVHPPVASLFQRVLQSWQMGLCLLGRGYRSLWRTLNRLDLTRGVFRKGERVVEAWSSPAEDQLLKEMHHQWLYVRRRAPVSKIEVVYPQQILNYPSRFLVHPYHIHLRAEGSENVVVQEEEKMGNPSAQVIPAERNPLYLLKGLTFFEGNENHEERKEFVETQLIPSILTQMSSLSSSYYPTRCRQSKTALCLLLPTYFFLAPPLLLSYDLSFLQPWPTLLLAYCISCHVTNRRCLKTSEFLKRILEEQRRLNVSLGERMRQLKELVVRHHQSIDLQQENETKVQEGTQIQDHLKQLEALLDASGIRVLVDSNLTAAFQSSLMREDAVVDGMQVDEDRVYARVARAFGMRPAVLLKDKAREQSRFQRWFELQQAEVEGKVNEIKVMKPGEGEQKGSSEREQTTKDERQMKA